MLTLVSPEVKREVSEGLLAQIAEVELHFEKRPEATNLFVNSFRFKTNLYVLILKN